MNKQILTSEILPTLVDKTISWSAPIYKSNLGHLGYGTAGGVVKITAVDIDDRRPIKADIIEGDNICYAFQDEFNPGYISYSDSDRFVGFEVIEQ